MSLDDQYGPQLGILHEALQTSPSNTGLVAWLEHDPDLVAIVYGGSRILTRQRSVSSYYNKAFRSSALFNSVPTVVDNISKLNPDQYEFQRWLVGQDELSQGRKGETIISEGHVWSARALHGRWILLRGIPLPVPLEQVPTSALARPTNNSAGLATNGFGLADQSSTVHPPRCFMSEPLSAHQAFVRDFDWASTPVGPMTFWSSQLVETVSLVLTGTDPASVFWGPELTSVYNEAFIGIAGQKHPAMMGDTPRRAFDEVWDQFFEPRIRESYTTKKPFCEKGMRLLLERRGFPEETFMTFTFLPLLGFSGEVVGFYHTVIEETQQYLSKRRTSFLLNTSEILSSAQDLRSFWGLVIQSLSASESDTPSAALYSVIDSADRKLKPDSELDEAQSKYCQLENHVGYPSDGMVSGDGFWLHDDSSVFAPLFRASMSSRKPTILSMAAGNLPLSLLYELQQQGFRTQCDTIAICPLCPTNHDSALAFLIIGLSWYNPCDADYRSFIDLLIKGVSSSLASVILLEDERKRGKSNAERAAYESAQLTARLKAREIEIQIQERKFMVMAQQVPVGIFDLSPTGDIIFCNQAWHDMTGLSREDISQISWTNSIYDADSALFEKEWFDVLSRRQSVSFEARLKRPWQAVTDQADIGENESAQLDFTWTLAQMYPVVADDGSVTNVIGSITDISLQKHAMIQQTQRAEEAVEEKRQLGNFIDMTSHEMRNPLNAMLLCAQELFDNLQVMVAKIGGANVAIKDTLINSIDSAGTIVYCGRHQKRIIDDVLTLSKLDAGLLQIVPIEVQPVLMVKEMLKLFESELRMQSINAELNVSSSVDTLGVNTVLLDPSRVIQILVNFIANAIKFTKTEDIRRLSINFSVSEDQPSPSELTEAGIQLIPQCGLYQDPTTGSGWGTERPIYLQFLIRDTGPGIADEDMLKLFARFAQSRPKTHAHYGGSGLGLFISQQLAELQGGRVGIASELGVGSSFYFYVKAKHAATSDHTTVAIAATTLVHDQVDGVRGATSSQPLQSSTHINAEKSGSNLSDTNVLIVEDNLVNQKVLQRQLTRLGYNALVANHGEEALNIIRHTKIWKEDENSRPHESPSPPSLHVILMDIEMPVMDGRECVRRIREYERQGRLHQHIPIIALTANARPEQIRDAVDCGFDEVMSKPFQLAEVTQRIAKVLESSSHTDNAA